MKTIICITKEEALINIAYALLAAGYVPTDRELESYFNAYVSYLRQQQDCQQLNVTKDGTIVMSSVIDHKVLRAGIATIMKSEDPVQFIAEMFPVESAVWQLTGEYLMERGT